MFLAERDSLLSAMAAADSASPWAAAARARMPGCESGIMNGEPWASISQRIPSRMPAMATGPGQRILSVGNAAPESPAPVV